MVAIDSKSNSTSNLVGIKENITVDEVDMLFAELFALVHTENNEEKVDNNENIINITQPEQDKISLSASNFQNIDKKTEDLAKSLVQIFYKDLGIANKNEHNNTNFSKNKNITEKFSTIKPFTKSDQNKTNENLLKPNLKLSGTNLTEKNQQEVNISINVSYNPAKKNSKLNAHVNLNNDLKKNDLKVETNAHVKKLEKSTKEELNLQKKNLNLPGEVSEKKKISKKKQSLITPVTKDEDNETIKNQSPIKHSFNQINTPSRKSIDSNSNINKIKKEKDNHSIENKTRPTKLFATPETLNLMESSWGEKFSKMIKNAVANGLNKVEITLKPKSLGKINLDISVKDNSTKIQINAENLESANLLNENLGKLHELIENKNDKFSNFFGGDSNNYFNNQKKQRTVDNPQTINKKKSVEDKKTVISNHNIDVQA